MAKNVGITRSSLRTTGKVNYRDLHRGTVTKKLSDDVSLSDRSSDSILTVYSPDGNQSSDNVKHVAFESDIATLDDSIRDLEQEINRKKTEIAKREKADRIKQLEKELDELDNSLCKSPKASAAPLLASSHSSGIKKRPLSNAARSVVPGELPELDLKQFEKLQRKADTLLDDLLGKNLTGSSKSKSVRRKVGGSSRSRDTRADTSDLHSHDSSGHDQVDLRNCMASGIGTDHLRSRRSNSSGNGDFHGQRVTDIPCSGRCTHKTHVHKCTLDSHHQYSSSESDYETDSSSCRCHTRVSRRGKKHLKSGRVKKVGDFVRRQEDWPHTKLSLQFASKDLKYDSLDMPLFVAGTIESILSDVMSKRFSLVHNKLVHLKSLMYHATYNEWSTILDLHAAIVTEIERGHRNWNDSFLDVEQKVLSVSSSKKENIKTGSTGKGAGKGGNNSTPVNSATMFCKAYQSGKCNKSFPHRLQIGKKQFTVSHICATCWIVNKDKNEHPESSKECKYFGQTLQEAKESTA